MTCVVFNISARTLFGELVFVTGNCRSLGDWDEDRAVALKTDGQCFPNWSATVFVEPNSKIEYKYFVRDGDGKSTRWELFPENRKITMSSLWLVLDDGKFGHIKEEQRQINPSNYDSCILGLPFLTCTEEQQQLKKYQEELDVHKNVVSDLELKVNRLQNQLSMLDGTHIKSLTIEQLKELAQKSRRVADQATELMMRKVEEENFTPRFSECVTCMDQQIDTIILPCAHLVVCHDCSFRLNGKCPICKQKIISLHRVFMK